MDESRMVTVTDDWYPCCNGNQVLLRIMCIQTGRGEYFTRICAWGDDDTGVELDYKAGKSKIMAESIYKHWKKYIFDRVPDGVDMEWFFEHGFYRA